MFAWDLMQDPYLVCAAGGGGGARRGELGVCFFKGVAAEVKHWGSPQMHFNLDIPHPSLFYLLRGTPKGLGLV